MNAEFWNTVRRVVGEMLAQQGQARHGIVRNVDPARGLVRVEWDEDGTLSGWLPLAQAGAGAGWSMVAIPEAGAQAFTVPDMGDASHGVVVGFTHTTGAPPPMVPGYKDTGPGQPAQPGELLLVNKSGASLRLTANGTIVSRGTWMHDGDIQTSGSISVDKNMTAQGTITGEVDVIGGSNAVSLAHHRHLSYGPNSTTSPPI